MPLSPRSSVRYLILPVALVALVFAGCGSSKKKTTAASTPAPAATASTPAPASGSGGGSNLKLAAAASALKFDKTSLTAKAGNVTIALSNPSASQIPHGISVEGNGVDKDGQVVQGGGTSTVSVTLKPGKYEFYCPVPGHKAAGMKGTLTVQ
jgi:uncharacterized cupredoxin-like copper-binding protein